MGSVWRDDELIERFERLTELLKAGDQIWRHHAFQMRRMPWERDFPALSQTLRKTSLSAAEQLASDNYKLMNFLAAHLSIFSRVSAACDIGAFQESPLPDVEPRDIPGRKWQQIRHFAPHIPANRFAMLEWCSGKSHLGRTLAHHRHCAVIALERNTALIQAGEALARREQVSIDFRRVDVLTDAATTLLQPQQNALALHACGDLHRQLLMQGANNRTATITLAPCCYHLIANESHYLLSAAATASGLYLQRDDLRTAVHGTVTAPLRQTKQRLQLQGWRLGFDLLQRDVRGVDEYLPTPSLPISTLAHGFESFCRQLATAKNIQLPSTIDYSHYEHAGRMRLREVIALDLPRVAFRRALELWLVLDRALFLREQGYRVALGEFCAPTLTPRNLLICAEYIGA